MTARLLVVGEALVDVVLTADGARTEHPGGSPLNVAVAASRLGVPCTLAAQLGADGRGELIRRHVEASDVRVQALPPVATTGTATARLDSDGAATYDFEITWAPETVPDPESYAAVHTGSIALALAPGSDRVLELLARARELGVPTTVDPNVRLAITPDVSTVRTVVDQAIRLAWGVKLSDEDADVLMPGLSAERVLDEILAAGPALVALTRGSAPMLFGSGKARAEVAAPATRVADTIGAGDTAMGAMLATCWDRGWLGAASLDDEQLAAVGQVAVEAAAITCSRPGADPPWLAEMSSGLHAQVASPSAAG